MQYKKSQKEIKNLIQGMAGKYSSYDIFRDFIVLSACAISNSVDKVQWEKREKMYMSTIRKYQKDEAEKFAEMLALMTLAYESRMGDFIGELYMSMEFGDKHTGQFFTPYHVSKLVSDLTYKDKKDDPVITLNEPTCGSGGMIVAFAESMKAEDRNYQTDLRVICNDLDFDAVRMCYIQLSLLGIDAIVYQKNTLAPLDDPPGEIWYTPIHLLNKVRKTHRNHEKTTNRATKAIEMLLEIEKQPKKQLVGVGEQFTIFDYLEESE